MGNLGGKSFEVVLLAFHLYDFRCTVDIRYEAGSILEFEKSSEKREAL